MQTFKLIVTVSEKCVKVLRYISNSIGDINSMGVRLQVEKISKKEFDEDMVELLRRKGITRLPVLLAPDGASFIGVAKITELFERNLKNLKNGGRMNAPGGAGAARAGGGNAEMGSNPALTDFWMSEMYGGSSRDENGRITPKKDTDEGMDEQNDFDTKMRQYRERVPKHRGGGEQAERNIEAPARPRRRRQETPAREEPADNIAAEDMPEYDLPTSTPGTPIRAPRYTPTEEGGEDVDQKMLNAWLDNNPNEF